MLCRWWRRGRDPWSYCCIYSQRRFPYSFNHSFRETLIECLVYARHWIGIENTEKRRSEPSGRTSSVGARWVHRQLQFGGVSAMTARSSRCSGAHRRDMPGWGRMAHISGMEHSTGKGLEARDGSQELRVLVQCGQSPARGRANGGHMCFWSFPGIGNSSSQETALQRTVWFQTSSSWWLNYCLS